MTRFWVILGIFLVSSWIGAQAKAARARKVGSDWLFPPVLSVRAVFLIAAAMGFALAILCMQAARHEAEAYWGMWGSLLWAMLCVFGFPKSIWVSEIGLRQRNWFGSWKTLKWEAVTGLRLRKWDGSGSLVVYGENATIVFSSAHGGRERFLEELGKRNVEVRKQVV